MKKEANTSSPHLSPFEVYQLFLIDAHTWDVSPKMGLHPYKRVPDSQSYEKSVTEKQTNESLFLP